MRLPRRLESLVMTAARRALGVATVGELGASDIDALRVIARLFQILDREPVYNVALEHVVESARRHFPDGGGIPLVRALLSSLFTATADRYSARGFDPEAAALRETAQGLGGPADRVLLGLMTALTDQQFHDRPPLVVDAVVQALINQVRHAGPRINRANILSGVAYACFCSGYINRLRVVTAELGQVASTPGDHAMLAYFQSKLDVAQGQPAAHDDGIAALQAAVEHLDRRDPAYDIAQRAAANDRREPVLPGAVSPHGNTLERAGEAMRRQQWPEAARAYEQAIDLMTSPAWRAWLRLFAEVARLRGGELDDSAAINRCIDRLLADNLLAARALVQLEDFLCWLLDHTIDKCQATDTAPVVRICELLGEYRGGTAIRRDGTPATVAGDAQADLTLVDYLTQPASAATITDISAGLGDCSVVWINLLTTKGRLVLLVVTQSSASRTVRVRRLGPLDETSLAAWRAVLGKDAEAADDAHLGLIADAIFADVAVTDRLVVVPDTTSWDLPWAELVPATTSEFTLTPSVGALLRLPPASTAARPRIIGVFDDELPGAQLELAKLEDLHDAGRVRFVRAHSLAALVEELRHGSFDIVTIAVHGTTGNGFEYRMLLPDGPSSLSDLLTMPLPSIVIMGCCWSATSAVHPDTVAASLVCLVGGASQVVGGLWAIDDLVAGELLARTYEHLTAPTPVPLSQALLRAHRSLTSEQRRRAAGVAIIGRGYHT
ncbi:CHAT domain-containing protein [Micromonospora arida]|uniref:CHAT domain-containing protein n=1 Tax=Micromonospora arida TaxID=2203715 RepID=UPI0033B37D6A